MLLSIQIPVLLSAKNQSQNPVTSPSHAKLTVEYKVPIEAPVNDHSMRTRLESSFVCPRVRPNLLLAHVEPKTTKQALSNPTWLAAMNYEYALLKNASWSLVPLPAEKSPIGCKWMILRVKVNPDGRRIALEAEYLKIQHGS